MRAFIFSSTVAQFIDKQMPPRLNICRNQI